jgi:hypothetical protein
MDGTIKKMLEVKGGKIVLSIIRGDANVGLSYAYLGYVLIL